MKRTKNESQVSPTISENSQGTIEIAIPSTQSILSDDNNDDVNNKTPETITTTKTPEANQSTSNFFSIVSKIHLLGI